MPVLIICLSLFYINIYASWFKAFLRTLLLNSAIIYNKASSSLVKKPLDLLTHYNTPTHLSPSKIGETKRVLVL